jgi:hypothetical protein
MGAFLQGLAVFLVGAAFGVCLALQSNGVAAVHVDRETGVRAVRCEDRPYILRRADGKCPEPGMSAALAPHGSVLADGTEVTTVFKADDAPFFSPRFTPGCRCTPMVVSGSRGSSAERGKRYAAALPPPADGDVDSREKPGIVPEVFRREDFHEYTKLSEIKKKFDSQYGEWAANLSEDQIAMIHAYKKNLYADINKYLVADEVGKKRAADIIENEKKRGWSPKTGMQMVVRAANEMIGIYESVPALSENVVVYRTLSEGTLKHLYAMVGTKDWKKMPGYEGPFSKSFSSTALLKKVADLFPIGEKTKPAQLKLYIPKGSRAAAYIDAAPIALEDGAFKDGALGRRQTEMLLKPEAKVRILSVDETAKTIEMLVLE